MSISKVSTEPGERTHVFRVFLVSHYQSRVWNSVGFQRPVSINLREQTVFVRVDANLDGPGLVSTR